MKLFSSDSRPGFLLSYHLNPAKKRFERRGIESQNQSMPLFLPQNGEGSASPCRLVSVGAIPQGLAPSMPDILLTTLNAKYIHAAFGLRYLMANLGGLRSRAAIAEFDINQRPVEIAGTILGHHPRIVGIGVYIWNVAPATELVAILRAARPDLVIVLGGPEVSYECDRQEIVRLADYVITGEADLKFAEVCETLLTGNRPPFKIIPADIPDVGSMQLPYDDYDDRDAAHRVIYVEASRGCPFTCEFCLSSLDIPVRQFPLPPFLNAMQRLLDRGVRQFKFVDRTFNLNLETSRSILQFFLARWTPGLFVHFEMVPDRLPEALREVIAQFPPGALQFEVGIQTFNPEVERLISRRQNHERLNDNLHWLREQSGVHVHADLIAGLPGETLVSFAAGFDRLVAMRPQEIQVGILKRLRGTPIGRHDAEWQMVYNPHPPYEILQNRLLDFATVQFLRRFSRFWDLYSNSGHFLESLPWIWKRADGSGDSPFAGFQSFCAWLNERGTKTSGIALTRQYELLWEYIVGVRAGDRLKFGPVLSQDYRRSGRSDLPSWLLGGGNDRGNSKKARASGLPVRQARHLERAEPATRTADQSNPGS